MKLFCNLLIVIFTVLLFFTAQTKAFTLCIKTDKFEYTLGEPVVVYVSLQNTQSVPVELPQFLQPEYEEIKYEINGKQFPLRFVLDIAVPTTKIFEPGEIIRDELQLIPYVKEWLFSKPGIYTITAKSHGQSANVTIAVQTAHNNQASQLLFNSGEAISFLVFEGEGARFLTKGVEALEQIATDYPNSPLATYANQVLGHSLSFGGDYQQALPFLKTAQQQPVSLFDIVHTHMSLYESYIGLENTQEAEITLQQLKQVVSTQFNEFKPFVNTILSKHKIPTLFEPWATPQIEEPVPCQKQCPQAAYYNAVTGKLHIPCIKALDELGNITVYEMSLNQNTYPLVFDLDVNSIKAHQ